MHLPIAYTFTEEDFQVCTDHAVNVGPTTCYGARNGQTNSAKRHEDIIVGKLAEILVYNVLKPIYPTLTPPDMQVYKGRQKSWKSDLESDEFFMSVKGQNVVQAARFGTSWVFEKADKGLLPKAKPTYLALVNIDLKNHTGILQAILNSQRAIFGEVKLEYLRATKKAIYFDDIKSDLCHLEETHD